MQFQVLIRVSAVGENFEYRLRFVLNGLDRKTFGIYVMFFNQGTDKNLEIFLLRGPGNSDIPLLQKRAELFTFQILVKIIERMIQQHPSLLIDHNLRIPVHKLDPFSIMFDGWKVAGLRFVSSKVEQNRSGRIGYLQGMIGRITILTHQVKWLSGQQF